MNPSPNVERLETASQDAAEALIPAPRDESHARYTPTPEQRQAWFKQAWPDFDAFLATWEKLRQIRRDLETCPICGKRGIYASRGEYWIFRCYSCNHRDHNLTILEGEDHDPN